MVQWYYNNAVQHYNDAFIILFWCNCDFFSAIVYRNMERHNDRFSNIYNNAFNNLFHLFYILEYKQNFLKISVKMVFFTFTVFCDWFLPALSSEL